MDRTYSTIIKRGLLSSAAVLGFMLALSAWAWEQVPDGEEVPVHFNAQMEPDRWGSKTQGFLGLPGIAAIVTAFFALYPRFEPRRANLERSRKAYLWVWAAVLVLMGTIHTAAVFTALGSRLPIGSVVPLVLGAMFVVLGNFMGKIRSNFGFGIRTPWTLSSDLSWSKTHRLGGRLFVLHGGLVMISSALAGSAGMGQVMKFFVGGLLAVVAVLTVYSYLVWRGDPQRPRQH